MRDDDKITQIHGVAPCGLSHKFFGTIPPPAMSSIEKEKSMSALIVAQGRREYNLLKTGDRVSGIGHREGKFTGVLPGLKPVKFD